MSNPNRKFFLDVEAIALWLRIGEREVYKIVRANKIERNGELYDLGEIMKIKNG